MVPDALAFPETLADAPGGRADGAFLYEPVAVALADRLAALAKRLDEGALWNADPERGARIATRYAWRERAPALDDAAERAAMVGR